MWWATRLPLGMTDVAVQIWKYAAESSFDIGLLCMHQATWLALHFFHAVIAHTQHSLVLVWNAAMAQPSKSFTRTYGGRRNRPIKSTVENSDGSRPTSPLQYLGEKDDLPVSEMTRRMRKRSRNLSRKSSVEALAAQELVLKKQDDTGVVYRKTLATRSFPLSSQDVNDLSYQTPRPLDSPTKTEKVVQEPLSPVPIARRMLSRMSSRNMKENSINRNLASPFTSRPGSRSASPDKSTQESGKRPRLHVKSRTLSSSNMNGISKKDPVSTLRQTPNAMSNNRSDKTLPAATSNTHAHAVTHTRATSIPTIPPNPLDQISPQTWLVPPRAVSRSPVTISITPDITEHASFYFDTPFQVSTPAQDQEGLPDSRKARLPSIYSDDSDLDMSDTQESPTLNSRTAIRALVPPASPRKPGKRRRTIMHVSSDSIFSDALDFSTYVTDDESPGHVRRTTERAKPPSAVSSRSRANSSLGLGLDSAFSPAPLAGDTLVSGKRTIRATDHDSSDDDDICNLISSIDLNGTVSVAFLFPLVTHACRAVLDSLGDGPSRLEDTLHPMESISSAPLAKSVSRQRRKRGDTIRASDYPQPPVVLLPPRTFNVSNAEAPAARIRTTTARRTRSGTVTQASSNATVQSSVGDPGPTTGNTRLTTANQAGTSKAGRSRQETQKTKRRTQIFTKPVSFESPPPPDDEDDELLLTDEIQDP